MANHIKSHLIPNDTEYLINIKRCLENGVQILERSRELADTTVEKVKKLGNDYIASLEEPFINDKASQLIKNTTVSILKEHFKQKS